MSKTYNVLFLCHDNSGRSLMAEAMLNKLGHGRFHAYSAGSHPSAKPHPIAIEVLQKEGFDTSQLRPKHMDIFHADNRLKMDLVVSLCENSKEDADFAEWQGEPLTGHWHFEDPHTEAIQENQDHDTEYHHYEMVQRNLVRRLTFLLNFPDVKLNQMALQH